MAIKIYETCNFTSRERWNCKIFSLSEIFLQAAEDLKVPSYSVIKILSTSARSKTMKSGTIINNDIIHQLEKESCGFSSLTFTVE